MDEFVDGLFRPLLRLILWVLRILQFLAWDLLFSYIGWSIGWFFYRGITFGRFPGEALSDLDNCNFGKSLLVELTGLTILGGVILLITGLV